MKILTYLLLISIFFTSCNPIEKKQKDEIVGFNVAKAKEALNLAAQQYDGMMKQLPDSVFPRTTETNGKLRTVGSADWTSGFYPGTLWYLYEYTKDESLKGEAIKRTTLLENQKNNGSTHDLGFMLYCSYGNGLRISGVPEYKDILLTGAATLSGRYNEKVGCIKSWDWNPKWQFPVIVDNMMNLEYMFWAFNMTSDSTYHKQAVSHADRTIEHHYRSDNSSYHLVNYDTISGDVLLKETVQGFANESAWARGQAWGLYGYTIMYRETKDIKYLELANKIATFIFNHPNMPTDLIPYWDFDATDIPNAPRDASAAAIIASALLELSQYVDIEVNREYISKAEVILENLGTLEYTAELGENNHFILKHATGHLPKNSEIDVPINYADYYYVEALSRYLKLNN